MRLPKNVIIPFEDIDTNVDMEDEEEVASEIGDILSDSYGFCHYGFDMDIDYDKKEVYASHIKWDTSD